MIVRARRSGDAQRPQELPLPGFPELGRPGSLEPRDEKMGSGKWKMENGKAELWHSRQRRETGAVDWCNGAQLWLPPADILARMDTQRESVTEQKHLKPPNLEERKKWF